MPSVQLLVRELSANVDQTMLEIHSVNVDLNLAPPTHVVSMLTVLHLEAMLCANVVQTTPETPTPTATLTPAPVTHVVREPSVRTMVELQCASVHLVTLVIPM